MLRRGFVFGMFGALIAAPAIAQPAKDTPRASKSPGVPPDGKAPAGKAKAARAPRERPTWCYARVPRGGGRYGMPPPQHCW